MKRKLGIVSECLGGVCAIDTLPLLKEAGFECYGTGHYHLDDTTALVDRGNKLGIECNFIHAPFIFDDAYCNDMWLDGYKFKCVYNSYKETLDTAAACGIPNVVIHLHANLVAPDISDIGLARFDDIVEHAVKRGVNIAFENLIHFGIIAYITERYENIPNVGYCYDIGHEYCYSGFLYDKGMSWMDIFKDKAVTTHIHDSYGFPDHYDGKNDPDLHLLPFDGTLDYRKPMSKLDEYGYAGPLILEVGNGRHRDMPHSEFLKLCYEKVKKLSAL